jgi:hypothetical protein
MQSDARRAVGSLIRGADRAANHRCNPGLRKPMMLDIASRPRQNYPVVLE